MGHISASCPQKLKHGTKGVSNLLCNKNVNNCKYCAEAKLTRRILKIRERTTCTCEIIYTDLIGPISPKTCAQSHVYTL